MKLRLPRLTKLALVLGLVFIGAGTSTVFSSSSAYAYDKPEDVIDRDVSAWLTYRGIWGSCLSFNGVENSISRDSVQDGLWFKGSNDTADFGYLTYDFGDEGDDKTIDISCGDGSAIDRFMDQIMGFDDEIEAFCKFDDYLDDEGFSYIIQPEAGDGDCESSDSFTISRHDDGESAARTAFTKLLDAAPYRRPLFDLTSNARDQEDKKIPGYNAWRYWIGKRSLEVMCGRSVALSNGLTDRGSDSNSVVSVDIVEYETGRVTRSANYELTSDRLDEGNEDGTKFKARFDGDQHQEMSCGDMAERTRSYSEKFREYVINYYSYTVADDFKDQFEVTTQMKRAICGNPPTGGGELPGPEERAYAACVTNISARFNRAVDECRASKLDGREMAVEDRTSKMKACLRQKLPNAYDDAIAGISDPNFQDQDDQATDPTEDGTSCAIDGIGWIVCPVMNFLGKINDEAYKFINNFLEIPARVFNDRAAIAAWSAFRDMANVMFVIGFLFIVYAQITGGGLSNYTIKKMVPRLVIAAVLVNVSFYLCALAVDLSNIVGSGIYNLLEGLNVGSNGEGPNTALEGAWTVAVYAVLATALGIALLALIIFAPMSLLAFALVIIILIARQAFVILLVVISPLAFVAYLLPNTEDWFKKWWKMLSAFLMVFPIIALVFGASSLAARILMNVSESGDNDENMMKIVALGVLAVPLFAVPTILKGSLSAAGSIGARLSGLQDRTNRFAGKRIKESRIGEAKGAFDTRRQDRRLKRRVGEGRLGRINKAIDRSSFGRYIGGDRGAAQATRAVFDRFDEDVKAQKTLLSGVSNKKLLEDLNQGKGSTEYQAAVAGTLMSRDHRESHLQALEIIRKRNQEAEAMGDTKEGKEAREAVGDIQKQMAHDMKSKPWALGDQATGQLVEGTYGRSVSGNDEPQKHFNYDIQEQLKERVGTKLSAQSLATMNPDEMNRVYAAATSTNPEERLTTEQLASLHQAIRDIRGNKQMDALVKPEARAQFDVILPPGSP